MYTYTGYNIYGAIPLLFYLPLLIPFCPLFWSPLLTWNSPSFDRIRPPRSQVACKLTSPFSTLSHPSPLQIPSTQVTKRLTKTTSRIRLLLSGTVKIAAFATQNCSSKGLALQWDAKIYHDIHRGIRGDMFDEKLEVRVSHCVLSLIISWVQQKSPEVQKIKA